MLAKLTLGRVEILNREAVIEQLQKGNDKISLILKPTWYSEFASVCNLWSIPGWTEEDSKANEGLQDLQIFLAGNGELSTEQAFDEVLEEV